MWSCSRCHAAICGIHLVLWIGWGFTSIAHSFHHDLHDSYITTLLKSANERFSTRLGIDDIGSVCVCLHLTFFFLRRVFDAFSVGPVHCSRDPQTSFFNKTFIKNGFHGTIYTFKNYFAIMFSIFNFQQNKWYPNKLLLKRKKSCNERFQDHFMRCLPKVAETIVLKVILCLWNCYIFDTLVDALNKLKNLFLCLHHTFIGLQCSFLCRWF